MRDGLLAKGLALVLVPAIWVYLGCGGWLQTAVLALVLSVASVSVNIAALVLALVLVAAAAPLTAYVSGDLGTLYLGALTVVVAVAAVLQRLVYRHDGTPLGFHALARRLPFFSAILGIGVFCAGCLALNRDYPLLRHLLWVVVLALCWWSLRRHLPSKQPAQSPSSRLAPMLTTVAIACISVALSLGIVEIGARLLLPALAMEEEYVEYSPRYLYMPKPNGVGHSYVSLGEGKGKEVEMVISSQGLRDEVIPEKEPGEFRICMVGDSFTMGHATALKDSIPKQLEARLRALMPGRKLRVINCGMNGAGCLQEIGMLRERALPLKPDLVVLQFFPANDVEDALQIPNKVMRAYETSWIQRLDQIRNNTLLRSRLDHWAFRHLRSYQNLCKATSKQWITLIANRCRLVPWADLPRHPEPEDRVKRIEVDLKEWYPELDEGFRIMMDYTKEMRKDSQAAGADFMAYCIPDCIDISDSLWDKAVKAANPPVEYERGKGVRLTEEALKQNGIPCVPVAEMLRAHGKEDKTYFPFDGHLTEAGNDLVARTLAAAIQTRILERESATATRPHE